MLKKPDLLWLPFQMACTFHDWKEHLLPSCSIGLWGWQPIWHGDWQDRWNCHKLLQPSTIQFSAPVDFNTVPVEWRNFLALSAAMLCCVCRGTKTMAANFSNPLERNVCHLHLPFQMLVCRTRSRTLCLPRGRCEQPHLRPIPPTS